MKRSNEKSYPVTFQFENFLIDHKLLQLDTEEGGLHFANDPNGITADTLHEMLGEYEHGTVDWNTVLEMVGMNEDAKWIYAYYHGKTNDLDQDDRAEALQKKALEILETVYEDILLTMISK